MSVGISAAGYDGLRGGFYAPDKVLSAKVVKKYYSGSIMTVIAKSNFFSDGDIMRGGDVIYGIENTSDLFAQATDNNEDPIVVSNNNIDTDRMRVCQSLKMLFKLSDFDIRILSDNMSTWMDMADRKIQVALAQLINTYTLTKVMLAVSPDNMGSNAGRITHSVNLGTPTSPIIMHNLGNEAAADEMFNIYSSIDQVATESSWSYGQGGVPIVEDSTVMDPVMVIPPTLKPVFINLLRRYNTCCSENNAMITGVIGNIARYKIVVTPFLEAHNYGTKNIVSPILVIDANMLYHAFDVITSKWVEGNFDTVYAFQAVFDSKLLKGEAAILAYVSRPTMASV